jgi:thiamine biosynthesis lipoprotein
MPIVHSQEADASVGMARGTLLWHFHDARVLGTRLTILVKAHAGELAREAALAAKQEIDRLDRIFNWRRAHSEISELNRVRAMAVSEDLFAVLQLAETWRLITRGAFDGRMGALLNLWSHRDTPNSHEAARALKALRASAVSLSHGWVELSPGAALSLDAIAKGYIVDAALNAGRRAAPSICGFAVDIGGDIRCWGEGPEEGGWRIGIPDPMRPADNAPLVDAIMLKNAAIATSGRGPRDCVDGRYRSATLSPLTGRPAHNVVAASVIATHSADADAIATACLVLPVQESMHLVEQTEGVAARITDAHGQVHRSSAWMQLQLAVAPPKKVEPRKSNPIDTKAPPANKTPSLAPELRWPADWEIGIHYVAPEKKENERTADFRTPYMVIWITDEENRSVSTPVMVGQDPRWQKDNFVWWTSQGERAVSLVDLRSQATALSGRYRIFWGGLDENWQPLPIGKYVLHLETSQERGKHSHRSIELEIGRERFKKTLPNLPESGGLEITYGHYNDRFKDEE